MPLVYVQRFSTLPVFEIGTQYIESGSTLTLGNPTNVDMTSSAFAAQGIYVIFSIDAGATFNTATVSNLVFSTSPPGRAGSAYWDAATNTVRVQLS